MLYVFGLHCHGQVDMQSRETHKEGCVEKMYVDEI